MRARRAFDQRYRAVDGQWLLVKARHRQRFEGIDQRHHAARPRDVFALERLGIAVAVPAFVVGEREQRVLVDADDFSADFGVLFHLLPFGRGEAAAFVQHLGGHAELADVVQRRGLHDQIGQCRFGARGFGDQACIVAEAYHAVTDSGAFVILHGAREAAHQLHARGFEFGGAFAHQRLLLAAAVRQFDMVAHTRAQYFGVERLDDVIGGTQLKALDHIGWLVFRGEKNDRDLRRGGGDLECPAHVVAAGAGHVYVEQDQVGRGFFERAL